MIYNLYTIFDNVSKECGPVFQAKNFGVARRYVEDMVKNNPIKLEEFSLEQVATFNTETCRVIPLDVLSWDLSEICSADVVESVEEVKE